MDSSMKERNDKKAWEAYEQEAKKLAQEAYKRREEIARKHKQDIHPGGLGLSPEDKEAGQITKWFGREVKKLQQKYGIK